MLSPVLDRVRARHRLYVPVANSNAAHRRAPHGLPLCSPCGARELGTLRCGTRDSRGRRPASSSSSPMTAPAPPRFAASGPGAGGLHPSPPLSLLRCCSSLVSLFFLLSSLSPRTWSPVLSHPPPSTRSAASPSPPLPPHRRAPCRHVVALPRRRLLRRRCHLWLARHAPRVALRIRRFVLILTLPHTHTVFAVRMPDLPPPCHCALPTSPSSPSHPYHRLLLPAHLPLPHPDRAAKRASPASTSVGPNPDSSSPLMLRLGVVLPLHRHADARAHGSICLGTGLAQCVQHALKVATSAD